MTYDQLVTLDAIVKFGSFKAASEFLHKSQPSLSMAIKKLEEEFGIKLFSREAYRPALTDEGSAFYQKSLITLEKFNDLEIFAKELSMGIEPEINISIDAVCSLKRFSKTFQSFLEPHITTTLNLDVDMLEELHKKILNQAIDIAIGTQFEPHPDIEAIPLMTTEMIPVVSSKFYRDTTGTLEDLKTLPQIIVKSSSKASKRKIMGGAKGMKNWFTTDMYMKEQLILNGLGWGRLPSHQVKEQLNECKLSIVKDISTIQPIPVQLYLLRNIKKIMGPNTKRLWSYLSKQENCD
jgi:DNA-binding transcriptional LysR family regulator